jgi:hypothetical protein
MQSASQCSLSTGKWSLSASLRALRAASDAATTVMPPVATSCSPASVLLCAVYNSVCGSDTNMCNVSVYAEHVIAMCC